MRAEHDKKASDSEGSSIGRGNGGDRGRGSSSGGESERTSIGVVVGKGKAGWVVEREV